MKKIIVLLLLISVILSCKNNKNATEPKKFEPVKENTVSDDIKTDYEDGRFVPLNNKPDLREARAFARNSLNKYYDKNSGQTSALVLDYYVVDYIADGKGAPRDVLDKGEWYKFNKNNTYQHGFLDKIADKGEYFFDGEKIMILPDEKDKYPSEWKVLQSKDVMILVGTAKFANNSIQKHCVNMKTKPSTEVER